MFIKSSKKKRNDNFAIAGFRERAENLRGLKMPKKTLNNFPKSIRLDQATQQQIIDITPPTYGWSESIKLIVQYALKHFEMIDKVMKGEMQLIQIKNEKTNSTTKEKS